MDLNQITLTEIETLGLQSAFNFADGHAYHDLSASQREIVANLPEIWRESSARKVREAEWLYQQAFWQLARSPSLANYPHFRICPTASNSIDTVGTWLAEKKMKTALMHPTFDNLYLILKRRGVPVVPLAEEDVLGNFAHWLTWTSADAIFLVNPNNPTGQVLSEEQFRAIVAACAEQGKALLLDNTFRFFVEPSYDQYQILLDSGVTFLSIEDTGKVWPTQDMKASLLFYSADIALEVEILYEEIYLCVSNFSLGVLTEFLKDAHARGLDAAVWSEVRSRREIFRDAIKGSFLEIDSRAQDSSLSVEWVRIKDPAYADFSLMKAFLPKGLTLLPGRNFFWDPNGNPSHRHVRFSLLKPRAHFLAAVVALRAGLAELSGETPLVAAAGQGG